MRFSTIICGGLLTGVAGSALACELPTLIVIPPKDEVAGNEEQLRVAANAYFTGMQAYVACIQAELTAAGGDSAPDLTKRVLVSRNNTAVAEAEFMMKLFTDNVGIAQTGPEPTPAAR
jgi:hypothetical protein